MEKEKLDALSAILGVKQEGISQALKDGLGKICDNTVDLLNNISAFVKTHPEEDRPEVLMKVLSSVILSLTRFMSKESFDEFTNILKEKREPANDSFNKYKKFTGEDDEGN